MHDCPKIKDRILDFVFDELPPAQRALIAEHIKICAACRAEMLAAQKTLQTFDENAAALELTAREWRAYETNLLARFAAPPRFANRAAKALKTIAFSSVRVPAPIFAAVLLAALVGAGIFAARAFDPRIENAATATNAAPTSAAPPQTIEKPIETVVEKSIEKVVVREKIVKQIVFVERKTASKSRNSFAARNVEPVAEPNDQINLAEFKPVAKAAPSVEKAAPENRK